MKNKLLLIGAVVVLAGGLVLGGALLRGTSTTVERVVEKLGALTGPDINLPYLSHNGLTTWVSSGDFKSSTTTLLSIDSPNASTATVEFVQLRNSGVATTTYTIVCGAAPAANAYPTREIINTLNIASSTNFGTIVNGVTIDDGALFGAGGMATRTRLFLGKDEHFVCKANTKFPISINNTAFSNSTEAFDGSYKVRITE